jgi:hypothetical protein
MKFMMALLGILIGIILTVGCGSKDEPISTDSQQISLQGPPRNLNYIQDSKVLSVGESVTCAIQEDKEIRCWPHELTHANNPIIKNQPAGLKAIAISVSDDFACALQENNQAKCWGEGSSTGYVRSNLHGEDLEELSLVATGYLITCGIGLVDKKGYCIRARTGTPWNLTPTQKKPKVGALSSEPLSFIAVKPNGDLVCGIGLQTGKLHCWGEPNELNHIPSDIGQVKSISLTNSNNCVIDDQNSARCWHHSGDSSPPAEMGAVAQISGDDLLTCAVRLDASVRCWNHDIHASGFNNYNLKSVNNYFQNTQNSWLSISLAKSSNFAQGFCGIREDRSVECFYPNKPIKGNISTFPAPSFSQVLMPSSI